MKTSFKYDGAYEYRLNLRSGSFHTLFLTWSRWNFIVTFYLPSETEIEPDLTLLKIRKKMTNLSSFREIKGLIAFSWLDCSLLLLQQTLALATLHHLLNTERVSFLSYPWISAGRPYVIPSFPYPLPWLTVFPAFPFRVRVTRVLPYI